MHNRTLKFAIIGLLGLVALLIPVGTQDPYYMDVLIKMGFWVIMALGLQLIMTTGTVSVAQVAFMGIGAYTSVLLVMKAGFSFWIAFPLSGIVAGVFALLIGIPALRTRGVYFIIVTLALSRVLQLVWTRWVGLFGGATGIQNIPPPEPISFFGMGNIEFGYGHRVQYYYLVLIVMAIIALVVYRLNWSRFGAICRSIREAEPLARSAGVNAFKYRLLVFVLGSFFAGFVGSLQAHYLFFISSETFPLSGSMYVIIYLMIGGSAGVLGPFIGVIGLILLDEQLRFLKAWTPAFFGGILVVVMTFLPDGVASLPQVLSRWFRKSPPSGDNSSPEAAAAVKGS